MKMCPCGKPLHYTDPHIEEVVTKLVAVHGEYLIVQVCDKKYKASRHFIALHGLRAEDIHQFEEITG